MRSILKTWIPALILASAFALVWSGLSVTVVKAQQHGAVKILQAAGK